MNMKELKKQISDLESQERYLYDMASGEASPIFGQNELSFEEKEELYAIRNKIYKLEQELSRDPEYIVQHYKKQKQEKIKDNILSFTRLTFLHGKNKSQKDCRRKFREDNSLV